MSYGNGGELLFGELAGGCVLAVLPIVRYLRIFSRRFGPRPRMASKSSTLLNAPYDFRICKIFSAVAGPIPGTCCNSCDVAVLMFTGFAGGFFFPPRTPGAQIKLRKRKRRENRDEKGRHAMAVPYCIRYVPKSITKKAAQANCFPWASQTSSSPNSEACDSICARSPTTTICMLAESRYLRAVASKSSGVSARTFWRYVSR